MLKQAAKKDALEKLKETNEAYQTLYTKSVKHITELHDLRMKCVEVLKELEEYVSKLANHPKDFDVKIGRINTRRNEFENSLEKLILKSKKEEYGGKKTPDQIMEYLNTYLPLDIRITSIWEAAPRFHARLNATKKHYRYIIDTNPYQDVFTRKYATHLPGNYDLHAMKEAAALLTGEHDFKSFCENKHMKKSTVRTIYEISFSFENGILTIDFFGNGFLYHMVRILTGTLVEVGEGARKPEDMPAILMSMDRANAGKLMPPEGLTLECVEYEDNLKK